MGNVHIQNLKGEQFDTELLYWDQRTQRIYSDEFIRIEPVSYTHLLFGVDVNKNSCAVVLLIKRWFLLNFNINVISLRR